MKSSKSFSTIEAVAHLGQFNGKHISRCNCCISNEEEVTVLSRGYLRSDNFYPLHMLPILLQNI